MQARKTAKIEDADSNGWRSIRDSLETNADAIVRGAHVQEQSITITESGVLTDDAAHDFAEGDRVRAASRPGFPAGTIVRLMERGFVLVRWDGDVLETAHHSDLARASDNEPR